MGNDSTREFDRLDTEHAGVLSIMAHRDCAEAARFLSPLLLFQYDHDRDCCLSLKEYRELMDGVREAERKVKKLSDSKDVGFGQIWTAVNCETVPTEVLDRDSQTPCFLGQHGDDPELNSSKYIDKHDQKQVSKHAEVQIRVDAKVFLDGFLQSDGGGQKFLDWLWRLADVHQHGQVCKGELALLVAALRRDGILPSDLTFVTNEDQNADNPTPKENNPCWETDLNSGKKILDEFDVHHLGFLNQEQFEVLGQMILGLYKTRTYTVFDDKENRVGPYRLKKVLGKGSVATVRLAQHMESKEYVAIKIMKKGGMSDLTRLDTEIKAMLMLKHPSIPQLKAVLESSNSVFFVLELCGGGNLYEFMNGRPLSESVGRYFFLQIVEAVGYCHSRGVVHRDLKLDNLLMDNNALLKVTDFGHAGIFNDGWDLFNTPHVGGLCHLAPEQLTGCPYSGEKMDIWSLGVILFQMLYHKSPFIGTGAAQIENIKHARYVIPDTPVSEAALDLISTMLLVQPEKRSTCSAILAHRWMSQGNKDCPALKVFELSPDKSIIWQHKCPYEAVSNLLQKISVVPKFCCLDDSHTKFVEDGIPYEVKCRDSESSLTFVFKLFFGDNMQDRMRDWKNQQKLKQKEKKQSAVIEKKALKREKSNNREKTDKGDHHRDKPEKLEKAHSDKYPHSGKHDSEKHNKNPPTLMVSGTLDRSPPGERANTPHAESSGAHRSHLYDRHSEKSHSEKHEKHDKHEKHHDKERSYLGFSSENLFQKYSITSEKHKDKSGLGYSSDKLSDGRKTPKSDPHEKEKKDKSDKSEKSDKGDRDRSDKGEKQDKYNMDKIQDKLDRLFSSERDGHIPSRKREFLDSPKSQGSADRSALAMASDRHEKDRHHSEPVRHASIDHGTTQSGSSDLSSSKTIPEDRVVVIKPPSSEKVLDKHPSTSSFDFTIERHSIDPSKRVDLHKSSSLPDKVHESKAERNNSGFHEKGSSSGFNPKISKQKSQPKPVTTSSKRIFTSNDNLGKTHEKLDRSRTIDKGAERHSPKPGGERHHTDPGHQRPEIERHNPKPEKHDRHEGHHEKPNKHAEKDGHSPKPEKDRHEDHEKKSKHDKGEKHLDTKHVERADVERYSPKPDKHEKDRHEKDKHSEKGEKGDGHSPKPEKDRHVEVFIEKPNKNHDRHTEKGDGHSPKPEKDRHLEKHSTEKGDGHSPKPEKGDRHVGEKENKHHEKDKHVENFEKANKYHDREGGHTPHYTHSPKPEKEGLLEKVTHYYENYFENEKHVDKAKDKHGDKADKHDKEKDKHYSPTDKDSRHDRGHGSEYYEKHSPMPEKTNKQGGGGGDAHKGDKHHLDYKDKHHLDKSHNKHGSDEKPSSERHSPKLEKASSTTPRDRDGDGSIFSSRDGSQKNISSSSYSSRDGGGGHNHGGGPHNHGYHERPVYTHKFDLSDVGKMTFVFFLQEGESKDFLKVQHRLQRALVEEVKPPSKPPSGAATPTSKQRAVRSQHKGII